MASRAAGFHDGGTRLEATRDGDAVPVAASGDNGRCRPGQGRIMGTSVNFRPHYASYKHGRDNRIGTGGSQKVDSWFIKPDPAQP